MVKLATYKPDVSSELDRLMNRFNYSMAMSIESGDLNMPDSGQLSRTVRAKFVDEQNMSVVIEVAPNSEISIQRGKLELALMPSQFSDQRFQLVSKRGIVSGQRLQECVESLNRHLDRHQLKFRYASNVSADTQLSDVATSTKSLETAMATKKRPDVGEVNRANTLEAREVLGLSSMHLDQY